MNLTSALNKIKTLKGKLSRLQSAANKAIIIKEGVAPDHNFLEIERERQEVAEELRQLKVAIAHTNQITTVEYQGDRMTLAELILINADLRSELAVQQARLSLNIDPDSRGVFDNSAPLAKSYAEGFSKKQLELTIDELNNEKSTIDALIGYTNASTTLSE